MIPRFATNVALPISKPTGLQLGPELSLMGLGLFTFIDAETVRTNGKRKYESRNLANFLDV